MSIYSGFLEHSPAAAQSWQWMLLSTHCTSHCSHATGQLTSIQLGLALHSSILAQVAQYLIACKTVVPPVQLLLVCVHAGRPDPGLAGRFGLAAARPRPHLWIARALVQSV